VHLPGEPPVAHRDTRFHQARGVQLAFVAQHVMLGGEDHRRRQAGEARAAQR